MNNEIRRRRPGKSVSAIALALAMAITVTGAAVPAFAQDSAADTRIRKLEAEIKALQRKVFPGADGKFFQPEITAGNPASANPAAGAAAALPGASTASELLKRFDDLESQIARLTGQLEQNTNRIAQLEARAGMAAPGAAAPATATAPAPLTPATAALAVTAATAASAPAATTAAPVATVAVPAAPRPVVAAAPSASPVVKPVAAAPATPAASAPSAARVAAVRAIVKPQTDDPGDDEYSYGFRLWEARFYPEAQQQLMMFLGKYPRHKRVSWGRNLLGRAYLDEGNPKEAAKWFLENYQSDKRGERAPDSLLFLAESMKRLKDTKRACIALAEFGETYAAEAAGRLKTSYDGTRSGLACS